MRSVWKGICSVNNLSNLFNKDKVFLTRNTTLTPLLVNMASSFFIHNGKVFTAFDSKGVGSGFKVGSFNFTKLVGMRIHTVNKRTSKKK